MTIEDHWQLAGGEHQPSFAAALCRQKEISGFHDGRGRPASDRFRVYRNNVIVSLRDALRTTFATTQRLIGQEFFDAAAVAYSETNKPKSPLLWRFGDGFAQFLRSLPGLSEYPFVPEVAQIEYVRVQAYHAADAVPLDPKEFAGVPQDALGGTTFSRHPSATILSLPKGGLGAWQSNQSPPRPASGAIAALVCRPHMEVLVTPLDAPTAQFARALFAEQPLGSAADCDDLDLAGALGTLLSAGAFVALRIPDPTS